MTQDYMLPDAGALPSWLTGHGVADTGLARMTKARGQLVRAQTFYGALAMGMEMVATDQVKYLGTDGTTLYYNPQGVEELSEPELQGAVAQAVIKVSMLHHVRMQGRDEETWQEACESVTRPALRAAGFTLPKSKAQDMGEMSAEEAYGVIQARKQNSQGGGNSQQGNKSGQGQQGGGAGGQQGSQPSQGAGNNSQGNNPPGQGNKPSQGGGNQPGAGQGTGGGDSPIVQVIAPKDPQAAEQKAQVQALQAANLSRNMGDGTPEIEFLCRQLREPETPWDALLRDFMERQARNDYSWARPSRRFTHMGLYMPCLLSRQMGTIDIGVDTSGSLSESWLERFGAEIRSILTDLKPARVRVFYCDTQVHRVDEFTEYDEFELRAKGRGGTDFRPVFDAIRADGEDPDCLLYFTDMECTRFPQEVSYPVLWAACGDGWKRRFDAPPFGTVVTLEERGLRLG